MAATTALRVPQVPVRRAPQALVPVLRAPATTRLHRHRACPVRVQLATPKPALQAPVRVVLARRQAHPVRALRVRQVPLVPVDLAPALRVPVVPAPRPA